MPYAVAAIASEQSARKQLIAQGGERHKASNLCFRCWNRGTDKGQWGQLVVNQVELSVLSINTEGKEDLNG